MRLELTGNYFLRVEFGGNLVGIEPSMIKEVSITQDLDTFLPSFRLAFMDSSGLLREAFPYDSTLNKVSIEIGKHFGSDKLNKFDFRVLRRTPTSDGIYEVAGILDVDNLFDNDRSRSWSQSIKTTLQQICENDLEIFDHEISDSLDYSKTLVQPESTNAQFLNYLKKNLIGKGNQAGYQCTIRNSVGKRVFLFRSLDELFVDPVRYRFLVISDRPFEDHYPVIGYNIHDNSGLMRTFTSKQIDYSYFDFDTGVLVDSSRTISEVPSLTEQFLINDDDFSGTQLCDIGRSNDFTTDFSGKTRSYYYNNVSNLINMWATTWGLENAVPGDIVRLVFTDSFRGGNLNVYQHSGYWLVRKVVHLFGTDFQTNLLLTRGGVDTEASNTLTEATNRKRK